MNDNVILLIEDDPDDIELTRRAFKKSKISNRLVVAQDGAEALDYLANCETDDLPVLILLDLKLPKITGLEVLRSLRAADRTRLIPIVVLTSSTEEQDIVESYSLGANSYIRKPVDFLQFVASVQQLGLYWLLLNEPPPV